jgi:hypothetical protein
MFELTKDIDRYTGIPPYASEHYGVYQPLLGWESKLTKNWIAQGGVLIDPRIKRILDDRLVPGPQVVQDNDAREFVAHPLAPGTDKSPFKVMLAKDLNSELLKLVRDRVQAFVTDHGGKLPHDAEWNELIDVEHLIDAAQGLLRKVNDIHRQRLFDQMQAQAQAEGHPITVEMMAIAKQRHLELMQYESQIASFLLSYAEGRDGFPANDLSKLFFVKEAPPLSDILRSTDPLANIDPDYKSAALSPVGFVHLFRQYFFDLGTFLGESVEHIWLAPGTTIELVEVSTRKTIVERTEENNLETNTRSESSAAIKEEISDALKTENSSNTKLGVSTTQGVNYGVYQGTATASFGTETTRKAAREDTHRQTREKTEKLTSEIKQSFKSIFRAVTETTDLRSRRYVLENKGNDLINYELRRKMRRVGIQLQDLGTQLCWQVFVDNAGLKLGLAELVHFAESPDLSNLKGPEIGPPPAAIAKTVSLPIAFRPMPGTPHDDKGADYGKTKQRPGEPYSGNRTNTNDADEEDKEVVMGPFNYTYDPPQRHYVLKEVRLKGPQGNKQAISRTAVIHDEAIGSFELVLDHVNFGGEPSLLFDVDLVWKPLDAARTEYDDMVKAANAKYNDEVSRLRKKSFMESVRQRIKDASNIRSRPAWDLREEERTIVYRALIEKLMLDSWKIAKTNPDPKDGGNNLRLSHVRAEVVRSIFDVDAMLYFVAPEWWMPRRRSQLSVKVNVGDPAINLTENDVVKWDDIEPRDDNYKITDDSSPAKLGSSLGWLLQLDGDNLRNAFLNAPWVKAVIPIRPGREKAALGWLRGIEGHENDGWNTPYLGNAAEDAEFIGKNIGEVLEVIADRMEKRNGEIEFTLEADKVFEKGFSHLANGFDAGLPANNVFSQWISVLPTDQIVAADYKPTEFFKPDPG